MIGFSADILPEKKIFFLKFRKRHSPSPLLDDGFKKDLSSLLFRHR
jgi:hypothetical protein